MTNILKAVFTDCNSIRAGALYQYDYGQKLQIDGIPDLPNVFEAHFANYETGESTTQIGTATVVDIPDAYLLTGRPVYVWIYLHTGAVDGETVYKITIPVEERAKPTDEEPTPVQQSEIDQAIAALNAAVNQTAASEQAAVQSALEASGSATAAADSATIASAAAQTATQAANAAAQSAESAAASEMAAGQSADEAEASAENAEASAERAEQAAATAGYMIIEINEHGHLIYTRTDQVDVDFSLVDGHLIMEAVA